MDKDRGYDDRTGKALGQESGDLGSGPYATHDSLSELRHVKLLLWVSIFQPLLPHQVKRQKTLYWKSSCKM